MLTTPTNRIQYLAGGASPNFAVTFVYYHQSHLEVYQNGTLKLLGTHYTVVPTENTPTGTVGGTVIFVVTPPVNDVILIVRKVPSTQVADLKDLSIFPADIVERGLDLGAMLDQQHEEQFKRALILPVSSIVVSPTVPDIGLAANQGKLLKSLLDGTGFEFVPLTPGEAAALLTTKGDLIGHNGSVAGRVGIGVDGEVLMASSIASPGLAWRNITDRIDNIIVNGNFDVWQRGTTFSPINGPAADRWEMVVGTGALSFARSAVFVPTPAEAGTLMKYACEIDVTTADIVVGAADRVEFRQALQQTVWRQLIGLPIVLSFWVRSSKTGVYCAAISHDFHFIYVAEYTVNVASTWEKKVIVIPASPTTGWQENEPADLGSFLSFALMAGTDFHQTSGSWIDSNVYKFATSNQVNFMDNTANIMYLTGIKLEPGTQATPTRNYRFEDTLRDSQRFYQKSFNYTQAPVQNLGLDTGEFIFSPTNVGATLSKVFVPLPVPLRWKFGSITLYNPSAANAQIRNITDAADFTASTTVEANEQGFYLQGTGNAGLSAGDLCAVHWTFDGQ